jgi:hypothetical protein
MSPNVTLIGALLCAILGSQVVVSQSKSQPSGNTLIGYAGLSIFFGVLVVIAPFLYNATAQPCKSSLQGNGKNPQPHIQEDHHNEQDEEIEHHGLVWAFLGSCILTLWAVFGQLETIWYLLGGQTLQQALSSQVTLLFQFVMGLAILLVIYYGFTSIFETVQEQVKEDTIYAGTSIGEQDKEEFKQIKPRHTRKSIHPL